eukprot:Hpha_TRINITY_DN12865_c0_g1::TRINITY_DN12865_c0_g1_i1::g.24107::m.24107
MGCKGLVSACGVLLLFAAVGVGVLQTTVWWAGYDLQNCPGCVAKVDWSAELSKDAVSEGVRKAFAEDGVVVLPGVLGVDKVNTLGAEIDGLPNTIMTDVIARFLLKQYRRYEHRLDTRSELFRDWALHGPLGKWAAKLLGVPHVRLYNAEAIYSAGEQSPCRAAWHRDTVAAPFDPSVKAVTFNVYLDDIAAGPPHGDVLIYMKGSHKRLLDKEQYNLTQDAERVFRPSIKVGDVMAHSPHVYHTPSGEGCWRRRSLQFRYVGSASENPTRFAFGPNRMPHGPVPWTFAHAAGVAPHGLTDGDELAGPWYPRVYPSVLPHEHAPLKGQAWGALGVLKLAKQSGQTIKQEDGKVLQGGFSMDGLVVDNDDWNFVEYKGRELPCHKKGMFCKDLSK